MCIHPERLFCVKLALIVFSLRATCRDCMLILIRQMHRILIYRFATLIAGSSIEIPAIVRQCSTHAYDLWE